ncbi:hypothetical protein Q1695_007443 [Nippostrongylus brasiliensis]|nr:hypothetical protein Q1695_007443 [Nippostrongylus brasiliensis]
MEDDCSDFTTTNVTIEIDDEVAQGISAKDVSLRKQGPWIRPPLRIEEVHIESAALLSIADLSDETHAVLNSHLSMPSYGSLKSWDSVGVQLGIPDHEIMSFRQYPRPMEAVLKRCRSSSAKAIVKALQFCNRVDVLYSLKRLEKGGKLGKLLHSILLIHHEGNADEIRDFRWLRKNLVQHASRLGFHINDIAELDVDANFTSSLEEAFAKAKQIVVSFTPSYIEAVKCRSIDCRAVVYMHDLMNQEFFALNSTNRRFRAVIFNDTQLSDLPLGWARSTLVYHFPSNMTALCSRIFKRADQEQTTT